MTYALAHRVSQAAVVLQAVERTLADGAFEQLLSLGRPAPTGEGLFVGSDSARPIATARVNLDVRLHRGDLATLDTLVADQGANDRTQFVTMALRHFLN
ncbi:MAG: hypothetical protein WKF79_01620 [Nocardioides sp.]